MLEHKEKIYTSTANKLFNHMDRLEDIKKHGKWRPINLQLCPTNKCNLNCSFCSVKERGDYELTLEEIKDSIDAFMKVGPIESLEISGGGDPTMYKYINEVIEYGHDLGLHIGLITNGVLAKKKITQENLDKLMWLRISLSCFDVGMDIDVPTIKGTLGFSYVWHDGSKLEVLDKIYEYAKKYDTEYVRIVPDCLVYEKQMQHRDTVNRLIKEKGYSDELFVQTKAYDIHDKCYIGYLKPCLYSDGYLYQCTANALYERKFTDKWRMCHMKDIVEYWSKPMKAFPNSMCRKGKCFYCEHNKLLDDLQIPEKHKGFI